MALLAQLLKYVVVDTHRNVVMSDPMEEHAAQAELQAAFPHLPFDRIPPMGFAVLPVMVTIETTEAPKHAACYARQAALFPA